jgi:SAM-dependent methyltransferase
METEDYVFWCKEIDEKPRFHRKQWEFFFILKTLKENNMLIENKHGIGFGVGKEPIPSLLAKYKVYSLATDLNENDAIENGWATTNQYSNSYYDLYKSNICSKENFEKYTSTRVVDMNNIPNDFDKLFDFTWSSCALEHLGNLQNGLTFIENSLKLLKPGGIAVHTTEYNISSNEHTISEGPSVLYMKKDLQAFVKYLQSQGYLIDIEFDMKEDHIFDKYIDVPPYCSNKHLKLQFDEYVTTSIALVIYKPIMNIM